jgi:hypothetical protein
MAASAHILTANRLRDGEVVYWRGGEWVSGFPEAEAFREKSGAQAALTAAEEAVRARLVVNPYLFDVDDRGRPIEERERIRAAGPTVRRDIGKQAAHVPL